MFVHRCRHSLEAVQYLLSIVGQSIFCVVCMGVLVYCIPSSRVQ